MENNKNNKDFESYLENVYRKILNVRQMEMTKNVFNYFEEMYNTFKKQIENLP